MDRIGNPGRESARATLSLGRFLLSVASVRGLLPVLTLILTACGGGPPGAPETPGTAGPTLPAVERGSASPSAEAEASRLLASARRHLADDRPAEALEAADRILSAHPTVVGSSEALWIRARAALRLGRAGEAAGSAERFLGLLPAEHPLRPDARLVRGRALLTMGRDEDAVSALLPIREGADEPVRSGALEAIRESAPGLSMAALRRLTEENGPGWPRLRAPLLAELALALHARERRDEATRAARSALSLSEGGPEAELARSVLADEVTVERRRTVRLAAMLPRTGSPGAREYASLVEEGIRVRLDRAEAESSLPVQLRMEDAGAEAGGTAEVARALTTDGVSGVIGPLGERALEAAVGARRRPVPMISPSASSVPEDAPGVYSLSAPDPEAGRLLARYAADRRLNEAVVVHPRTPAAGFEARAFTEAYEALGGRVLERVEYPAGSTFFRDHLERVRELQPAALVLPLPPEDVELLAPQVTYFGLDTLGIQVLGSDGWVRPGALDAVEPRHTDGVVVATPRRPGRPAEAQEAFVEAYEGFFQKTLRSPVPALGYDAAGLLLEAVRTGARSPGEVRDALEGIRDFQGATGTISIREGRIVREHYLVRLRNRQMIPIRMDFQEGSDPP